MKRLTAAGIRKQMNEREGFAFEAFAVPADNGYQVDWSFRYRGGYTVYSEDVEPARIFKTQAAAEAHGKKLADQLDGKWNGYTDDVEWA